MDTIGKKSMSDVAIVKCSQRYDCILCLIMWAGSVRFIIGRYIIPKPSNTIKVKMMV